MPYTSQVLGLQAFCQNPGFQWDAGNQIQGIVQAGLRKYSALHRILNERHINGSSSIITNPRPEIQKQTNKQTKKKPVLQYSTINVKSKTLEN